MHCISSINKSLCSICRAKKQREQQNLANEAEQIKKKNECKKEYISSIKQSYVSQIISACIIKKNITIHLAVKVMSRAQCEFNIGFALTAELKFISSYYFQKLYISKV